MSEEAEKFDFQVETVQLMTLMKICLYSDDRGFFLRELIRNSSDALDKIHSESLTDKGKLDGQPDLFIRIVPDKTNNTLTIIDSGVGMTKADLVNNLGTIARPRTKEFLEALSAAAVNVNMIEQFGVGFYAVYLVADKVVITTKHNDDEQYVWETQAGGTFTVTRDASGEPLGRGTKITLFLNKDQLEYLVERRLKVLIKKQCKFTGYPVSVWEEMTIENRISDDEEQTVYNQIPPLSPDHPWIVTQNFDAKKETEVHQIFYSVHDPFCHYRCHIPQLAGKNVKGCFYGWVILSSHPRDVKWYLWNPVTQTLIHFPRLNDDDDDDTIEFCCLTLHPDNPSSLLLMTRTQRTNFLFCKVKGSNRRWCEMSYGHLLARVTGKRCFLKDLTSCNGEIYAYDMVSDLLVIIKAEVKDRRVLINLFPLLKLPRLCIKDNMRHSYLVGTANDIFVIYLDFDTATGGIVNVNLFKFERKINMWRELEHLEGASIVLDIESYSNPEFCIGSELGGLIHIFTENGSIVYSYHVKEKTMSISYAPCLVGSDRAYTWGIRRLLEGDHKQKKGLKNKIVVSRVESHEVEQGVTDISDFLNFPFDVLETIIGSCVGVEYLNFRASCKSCHLAAPLIQWSKQTALKRLQLQQYTVVSPWLMVFGRHTITFYDPMSGDKYFLTTPPELRYIDQIVIHCSKYGWLLMGHFDSPLFFFNPFTCRDTYKLPYVPDGPNLQNFIFSAPPTASNCVVIGFTSLCEDHVHIHHVGRESFWRRYALCIGSNIPDVYRFPTFHDDDVYTWCNGKGLSIFKRLAVFNEWGLEDFLWMRCQPEAVPISSYRSMARHFMVKCNEHLLVVVVGEFGESVEVFSPNPFARKWDKMADIGSLMIYICDKTCLCMEAKTPEMMNKIYFQKLHNGKIVFYSLKTQKFHTFDGGSISESFPDFFGTMNHLPLNAWIEPAWS